MDIIEFRIGTKMIGFRFEKVWNSSKPVTNFYRPQQSKLFMKFSSKLSFSKFCYAATPCSFDNSCGSPLIPIIIL